MHDKEFYPEIQDIYAIHTNEQQNGFSNIQQYVHEYIAEYKNYVVKFSTIFNNNSEIIISIYTI